MCYLYKQSHTIYYRGPKHLLHGGLEEFHLRNLLLLLLHPAVKQALELVPAHLEAVLDALVPVVQDLRQKQGNDELE